VRMTSVSILDIASLVVVVEGVVVVWGQCLSVKIGDLLIAASG